MLNFLYVAERQRSEPRMETETGKHGCVLSAVLETKDKSLVLKGGTTYASRRVRHSPDKEMEGQDTVMRNQTLHKRDGQDGHGVDEVGDTRCAMTG